jgi:hypothetical protein
MSKREMHRYRFSQRVGIAAMLWAYMRDVFDSSETAPLAVLTAFSTFSSVCLQTNAGYGRVLLNCNSLFTSRLTIRRYIVLRHLRRRKMGRGDTSVSYRPVAKR